MRLGAGDAGEEVSSAHRSPPEATDTIFVLLSAVNSEQSLYRRGAGGHADAAMAGPHDRRFAGILAAGIHS